MATRTRSHPYQRTRQASGPMTRLIVSGLHYEITEADVEKIFQPYGAFSRKPTIRFDRSGRSTGFAYVNYEKEEDATLAQSELDGVLAKGEQITVKLDTAPPPRPAAMERDAGPAKSGKAGGSLLSRIEKDSLLNRLSDATPEARQASTTSFGPGPVRRTRGNAGTNRGKGERGGRGPKPKPKPKTAEDLDKELEQYVQDGGNDTVKADGGDVDMAA